MAGDDAFLSAVERARAVAAKITGIVPAPTAAPSVPTSASHSSLSGNGMNQSNSYNSNGDIKPIINSHTSYSAPMKRSLEDDEDPIVGSLKKMAYSGSSNGGAGAGIGGGGGGGGNGLPNFIRERPTNGNTVFKPTQIYLEGIIHNGEKTLDLMLPGNKVGYVIGKGGEMIRNLQERAGVKMTVIQQSSDVTDGQKQLRIVGEPKKVDYAQQLVNDMLTDKETDGQKFTSRSEYGANRQMIELPVSPQFIGLVIGKGGENIKRISQETGAKLQVDTTKTDGQGNKICQITGTNIMSLNMAADMVKQILDNAANGRFGGFTRQEELRVQVPMNKTGLVIGKGGETVKALKQQCGCSIELDKNSKGIFIIRGPPERVPYAQQLISEKVQSPLTVISSTLGDTQPEQAQPAGYDQYWATQSQYGYQPSHDSSKQPADTTGATAAGQDPNAAWAAYYAQYYAAQQQSQMAQAVPAATGAASPSGGQVAASADGQQDYAAQWAEYYRYYGMEKEAEMIEQIKKSQ